MWQTCYHKLFNEGWFNQIEIVAQLKQEITYHKLFSKIKAKNRSRSKNSKITIKTYFVLISWSNLCGWYLHFLCKVELTQGYNTKNRRTL